MIKFSILFLSAVAVVVIAANYLRAVDENFSSQLISDNQTQAMRHEFVDFVLINTDSTGKAEHSVHSPHTTYLANENQTNLDFPQMVLYRADAAPVNITADTAVIDHAQNLTTLLRNVDVSIPNSQQQDLHMKTEKLLFDNAQQLASTDQPVVVKHGESAMQGVGMTYEFGSERITFLNQVRGTYQK